MTVSFSTAVKNSRANERVDAVDLGSTNPYGQLWMKDALDNVLSIHNFSDPAFGAAADGAAIADTIADGTGLLTGSCTNFDVVDKDESVCWSGTVTAVGGGGDLESDTSSTVITAGETVSVSSLTYIEGG